MMYDWTSLEDQSAVVKESFLLEVLTPLMMHGARHSQVETRPPSFKGVLRYWWRAIQSAHLGGEDLFKKEAERFGAVESSHARKSPVRILLKPIGIKDSGHALLLPHKEKSPSFSAIAPGNALELVAFLPQRYASEKEWFSALFRLTFVLSGFGQRSRRGAGALQYKEFRWADRSEIVATLANLLKVLGVHRAFRFPKEEGRDIVLERLDLSFKDGIPICSRPLLWRVWIGSPLAFSSGKAEADKEAAEMVRKKISGAGHTANVIIQKTIPAADNRRLLGDIGDKSRDGSRRMASPLHATVRRLETMKAAFDDAKGKKGEVDGGLTKEATTQSALQYAYVPVVTEVCPVGYAKDVFKLYEERKREFLKVLGIRP